MPHPGLEQHKATRFASASFMLAEKSSLAIYALSPLVALLDQPGPRCLFVRACARGMQEGGVSIVVGEAWAGAIGVRGVLSQQDLQIASTGAAAAMKR